MVPVELKKKFSTAAASLLTEVEELYERHLKTICVERIVKPAPGKELFAIRMHSYRYCDGVTMSTINCFL
jgi:hypothetical protein